MTFCPVVLSVVELGVLKSAAIIMDLSFLLSVLSVFASHVLQLSFGTYRCRITMSSWGTDYHSLCPEVYLIWY